MFTIKLDQQNCHEYQISYNHTFVKIYDSYPSFRIEHKWTVAMCDKYG